MVEYLEKSLPIKILEIVFDFITDDNGIHWLYDMKSIKLDESVSMLNHPEETKKTLDELICSVYCKLCGGIFKKDDASKSLTYKLLWEFS